MKHHIFLFSGIAFMTACGGGKAPAPIDTTSEVGRLYAEAGKPRSKDYRRKIPGMVDEGEAPEIAKPVVKKPVTAKKPVTKDPWLEKGPVAPEEAMRLEAVYQSAWEFYRAGEAGQNRQKNYLQAAALFVKASRLPEKERRNNCLYNAACSYALAGKKVEALKFLELSVEYGFRDFNHIKQDKDLISLRKEKSYLALLKKYKADKDPVNKRPVNVVKTPQQLLEVYKAGDKLYEGKKFEKAALLYIEASAHKQLKQHALYNAACCYSLAGKKEKALEALRGAVKAGWKDAAHLKKDDDLKAIRDTKEFKEILAGLEGKKPVEPNEKKPDPGKAEPKKKLDPNKLTPEQRQELYQSYKDGDKLYKEKKYAQAAEKFEKSATWKSLAKNAHYNAACCWALAGKTDQAMAALKLAVKNGWTDGAHLEKDDDLKSLRARDDFKALIKGLKAK